MCSVFSVFSNAHLSIKYRYQIQIPNLKHVVYDILEVRDTYYFFFF